MDKKRLVTIIGLLFLLVITGIIVFFLTNDSSEDESKEQNKATSQKAEPALTREKDEAADEQEKIEAEKKRQEEEERNSNKTKDKKDVEKQSVDTLKKDAEFVLTKTIAGKSEDDNTKLNETATQEFGTNLPDIEEQDGDKKQVEIKNLKLDLGKKPDMKSDKLKGTLKFDLIIKPKKGSDIKPTTQIDAKRSVTFEREDEKLKVSELRS